MLAFARVASLTIVLTITSVGAATPAWASGSWELPSTDVSTPAADVWSDDAQTAAGTDGSLMAVWRDYGTSTELVSRLWDEGAWSASPVSVSGEVSDLGDVRIVARGGGGYVVVWTTTSTDDATGDDVMTVWSSTYSGSSWAAPVVVRAGVPDEEIEDLRLASASTGTTVAAWSYEDNAEVAMLVGSTWSAARDLGPGSDPEVAASPDDDIAVVWRADMGSNVEKPAVQTFDGSAWTATRYLSDRGEFSPTVGATPTGFVAMWMEGNDRLPRASTFDGTTWSAPYSLRDTNQIGGGLTSPGWIVSTDAGTLVTWNDGGFGNNMVWAAVFDGTSWSPTFELLAAAEQAVDHVVTGGPDGTFLVVWQGNGGGELTSRIFTATTLGDPVELSSTETQSYPELAAGTNGRFLVVWNETGATKARLFDGTTWLDTVDFDTNSSIIVVADVTTENVFFAGWFWSPAENDRSVVRMTWLVTPYDGGDGSGTGGGGDGAGGGAGADGSGGPELAATGVDGLIVGAGLLGLAVVLAGAVLVVRAKRARMTPAL